MHTRYCLLGLIVALGPALSGGMGVAQAANAVSSAAPAATVTISGRALDSRGGLVEDARVTLCQVLFGTDIYLPTAQVVAEKNTGTDGTFTFTATKEDDEFYRIGSVIARKEGLALGWATWTMRADQHLDLTLGEPKELAGDVVDEQGRPVGSAEVAVAVAIIGRPEDQRVLTDWMVPGLLRVKTDDGGHFAFTNLPAEATFELLASKPGRATVCTFDVSAFRGERAQFSPGQAGIKITLPPEALIQGVVVEKAGGKPVGGIKVQALSESQRGAVGPSEAITAPESGTFHLGGLAPGSYTLQLPSTRGQAAEWVADPVPVSVKAGEMKSGVQIQLAKGAVIEVLVKETDGKPVGKASVGVRNTQSDSYSGGTTDGKGLARIRVMPGQYAVSGPFREGYSRPAEQERVSVEDGQTQRVELVLTAAPKIAGTVRDEAGRPLAGVKIEIKPMGGPSEYTTDAQGRFEVSWDPRMWGPGGTTIVLVAREEARNLAEAVEIEEQTTRLDLTLKPGGIVTGTVLNEEGKPLRGARVRVSLQVARWGSSLGRGDLATTGPDGRFEIKAVPLEQRYIVTALAEGYGKRDVTVEPGAMKDNRFDAGQFKLVPATLSITGVVVDPNDQPVAGAEIYGYGDGQPDLYGIRTDVEGKFTIKGVCPGPVRLNANSRTRPSLYGNATTEGGATDLRIVVSSRPTGQPYMPRRPNLLKGKPLPSLKDLGIDLPADAQDKMLLVCFWDMGQRPSRNCIMQLAARAAALREKDVQIVAIHAGRVEDSALRQWIGANKIPFPSGTISGDIEKTKSAWGVSSLPHLILTDKKRTVIADGFNLSDLDQQIEAAVR
jgi:protocatechuate 3,4-dioxygenase beta subunit